MGHQPGVDDGDVCLAEEVVLAQVRMGVEPLFYLGEGDLRHTQGIVATASSGTEK